MTPRQKRLWFVLSAILVLAFIAYAVLQILRENIVYFYTPTELMTQEVSLGATVRVGGMVELNSVQKQHKQINFKLTDGAYFVNVNFIDGLLPDLFKEGKGAIVKGVWQGERLQATDVLAKHDENYTPIELKDMPHASKKQSK